jgi:hypothetical protein
MPVATLNFFEKAEGAFKACKKCETNHVRKQEYHNIHSYNWLVMRAKEGSAFQNGSAIV